MMWGWDGGATWFAIVMIVLMVLFWAAIVVGAVFLIRALVNRDRRPAGQVGSGRPSAYSSEAVRILEERYARGEIDQEDFLNRRRDLIGV